MKRELMVTLVACGAAMGQTSTVQTMEFGRTTAGPTMALPAGDVVKFVNSEFRMVGTPVKGAPYSADSTTESVQVLADGTRITHKNTATDYRDSEGRTRHEQTLESVGPWSSEQSHKIISINDPVAGVNYMVNPEAKTATKMSGLPLPPPLPPPPPGAAGVTTGAMGVSVMPEGGVTAARRESVIIMKGPAPANAGPIGPPQVMLFKTGQGPDGSETKTESLGTKTIEGLRVEGTRTTTTIPVGRIGNDRPIQMVSERWYSPDLQIIVQSKRTDPQAGETSYTLSNVRRAEPARSLFEPPADYTVEEGVQRIQFDRKFEKTDK